LIGKIFAISISHLVREVVMMVVIMEVTTIIHPMQMMENTKSQEMMIRHQVKEAHTLPIHQQVGI